MKTDPELEALLSKGLSTERHARMQELLNASMPEPSPSLFYRLRRIPQDAAKSGQRRRFLPAPRSSAAMAAVLVLVVLGYGYQARMFASGEAMGLKAKTFLTSIVDADPDDDLFDVDVSLLGELG